MARPFKLDPYAGYTPEAAVARGVLCLDNTLGLHWWTRLPQPLSFDMGSTSNCLLCQLFGGFFPGMARLFPDLGHPYALQFEPGNARRVWMWELAALNGFDAAPQPMSAPSTVAERYQQLNQLWRQAIGPPQFTRAEK